MHVQKKNILPTLGFILGTELIGYLSSFLSGSIPEKYLQLKKPPLAPPGELFGIVWPILYALMGFAAALIYIQKRDASKKALNWYFIQLFLNFLWSIVFFGLQLRWIAFILLMILDCLVIYMMKRFYPLNKLSFVLLFPYLFWILFATYLNLGLAILNS